MGAALSQLTGFLQSLRSCPPAPPHLAHAAALLSRAAEPRSVQHLADELALHRAYLSRVFKQHYQLAPTPYGRQWQLLHAVAQLSWPAPSVAAVAHAVGYADQSHLHRTLRQEFGCMPQQLRRYLR